MGREINTTAASGELVLDAQLTDKQPCPDSGDKHYGLVMKYKVITVHSGSYEDEFIYVVHGAPELARCIYFKYCGNLKEFEVGSVHTLRLKEKLRNPSPFEIVIDPYLQDDGLRYLCLKVDLCNNASTLDSHTTADNGEEELCSEGTDEDF